MTSQLCVENRLLLADSTVPIGFTPLRHIPEAAMQSLPHGPNSRRVPASATPCTDVRKAKEVFYETLPWICVLSIYVAARSTDAKTRGLHKIDDT